MIIKTLRKSLSSLAKHCFCHLHIRGQHYPLGPGGVKYLKFNLTDAWTKCF